MKKITKLVPKQFRKLGIYKNLEKRNISVRLVH